MFKRTNKSFPIYIDNCEHCIFCTLYTMSVVINLIGQKCGLHGDIPHFYARACVVCNLEL